MIQMKSAILYEKRPVSCANRADPNPQKIQTSAQTSFVYDINIWTQNNSP